MSNRSKTILILFGLSVLLFVLLACDFGTVQNFGSLVPTLNGATATPIVP